MAPIPPKSSGPPLVTTGTSLALAGAKVISAAAEARAAAMGLGINIAIVDPSLQLLHFVRTADAKLTSVQTAIDKAFTAAGHRAPTHVYTENIAFLPGGAAEGIGRTNGGRFITIGGGIPVTDAQGAVIGAVGASGGTPAQDREIVEAGIREWEKRRPSGPVKAKL